MQFCFYLLSFIDRVLCMADFRSVGIDISMISASNGLYVIILCVV